MWKLVLIFSLFCGTSETRVTCRDENNGEQDWYILYKAPNQAPLTGLEYLYINSHGVRKMVPSSRPYKAINHPDGVLANTLRPLFTRVRNMPPNFGFISYSDQPPGSSASQMFGHSKGVLLVDRSGTGVWLMHSTPQFPYARDQNNFWPETGHSRAQTFICVTFPYNQFQHIGRHLQYIGAFPFDHDIPDNFHQELRNAVNWDQLEPTGSMQLLTSSGGFQVSSIAKIMGDYAEDGDLYVTISEAVKSDLLVQTWGCQPFRDKSFCKDNKFKVENIESINTGLGNWKATVDHSKWCVAKANNWICVADINRAQSQYIRRGGALCIDNQSTKDTFHNFVEDKEDCKNTHILDTSMAKIPKTVNIPNTDCAPQLNSDFSAG